jgi:hypothetical protein
MMKVMSDLEQRLRNAFRILFYNQDKIRKEVEEIKKRLEELEQRLNNLFRIGDN